MDAVSIENSNKITNMAFVCACLVVWQHLGGPNIAAPFFFTVSGYMLARHVGHDGWWISELSKRVKSLLVPFVFWALATQLIMSPLSIYADRLAGRPLGTSIGLLNGNFLTTFGLDFTRWPYLIPLWYLRCLFLLVLSAPLWVVCARRVGWAWCALCLLANGCIGFIPQIKESAVYGVLTKCFTLGGLTWFSVGICLCLRGKLKFSHPFWVAAISAIIGYSLFAYDATMSFIAGPCVLLALWLIMPTKRFPRALASSAMAVYLGHMLFLFVVGAIFKHVSCPVAVAQLVTFVAAVAGSVALNEIVHKRFPKLAAVAWGGR